MTMNNYIEHCDEVLKTLSFFDPMNKERIILEMDNDYLSINPEFNKEDLDKVLNHLRKKKLIKFIKSKKGEELFIKLMPKRSLWSKFKSLLP